MLVHSTACRATSLLSYAPLQDVNKKTGFSALEWLETVIPLIGGKSGGKELVAQTRGNVPQKTEEAVELATKFAKEKLGEWV